MREHSEQGARGRRSRVRYPGGRRRPGRCGASVGRPPRPLGRAPLRRRAPRDEAVGPRKRRASRPERLGGRPRDGRPHRRASAAPRGPWARRGAVGSVGPERAGYGSGIFGCVLVLLLDRAPSFGRQGHGRRRQVSGRRLLPAQLRQEHATRGPGLHARAPRRPVRRLGPPQLLWRRGLHGRPTGRPARGRAGGRGGGAEGFCEGAAATLPPPGQAKEEDGRPARRARQRRGWRLVQRTSGRSQGQGGSWRQGQIA
mmetsp:Transcript_151853/g.487304  ORF Transcript_151853/g.487304 Transcript_151853/m.487304 type:complete len:256 (+) Transcript_151853:277-1044(+)